MMDMTTAEHLAAVCDAWLSFNDDAVGHWERRCDEAVKAAVAHLRPVLVDVDPAPPCRCLP